LEAQALTLILQLLKAAKAFSYTRPKISVL